MSVDTWDVLVGLPNAEFKFLVECIPGAYYECGSDWTSVGSNIYSHDCNEVKLDAVTDNRDELTERADLSTLQGASEGYFFDFTNQTLYVKSIDEDDLNNGSTTVVIMVLVYKLFATEPMVLDGYQYRPLVRQDSLPNMDLSVDDIVEGIYKFNFGSFRMNNDGWFDTASDDYVWHNRRVLIYIGGEDLPKAQYQLYFVGRVSDMYVSDEEVSFSVKDIRVGTFSAIPVDHYWKINYPNLETEGIPIPIWYGQKFGITPVCLDPYVSANLRAVADDGGAMTTESTEAHDVAEDDMTLLPSSPAVDDAYYFGHTTNPFGKINLLIGQQGVGDWELIWEYYDGSGWVDLNTDHELSDGSSAFTADADEDTYHTIEWNRPDNWATTSINSITAYWVRARVSVFTSLSAQPLGTRCKFDDTKGSKWKLAGHEIDNIETVRRGNFRLVETTHYTTDEANAEFTLGGIEFDSTKHWLVVGGTGKVISGGVGYSTLGADIAKDILQDYLGFVTAELDIDSFDDTNLVRTHALALYLDKEESSREVLQTVGRSTIAFFTPTEDGKLSFIAYEPTTPPGTLELFDADYNRDWRVIKDDSFVRHRVQVQYNQHPTTQEFEIIERENTDVLYKYGAREVLSIKTYVRLAADAVTIAEGLRDMCSKPVTVVETSFGMKGFVLFPTQKVILNRLRAADSSGVFDQKVFRIRRVSKDTSLERTHITGMDDLQTLGESFCTVCFSCQNCVSAEASCTDCYTCQTCYADQSGCQSCDTCQLCDTVQSGCETCDDCENCDDCESTVGTCETCQDCDACELCVTCESTVNTCTVCQSCYGCQMCDTCQSYVTCASCDTCEHCVTTCQNCVASEACTPCDVCDACQVANTCGSCDSCEACVSCEKCVSAYNRCQVCQICVGCEEQDTCGSCDSCQTCNNCQNCFSQQECSGCDTCNTCEWCVTCDDCNDCEDCYSCQRAN